VKKTQEKILSNNLSYHYKLKKDLIEGVLDYMIQSGKEMSSQNMAHVERNDYTAVTRNYIGFQILNQNPTKDTIISLLKIFGLF